MINITSVKRVFALTDQAWIVAALVCLFVAVILVWRGEVDGAFVAATLGVVAWFLNHRNRLDKTLAPPSKRREEEDNNSGDLE